MSKWIPDRKWFASGIAGVVTFLVITALSTWTSLDIGADLSSAISTGVTLLFHYLTKSSIGDVITKLDNIIKGLVDDGKLSDATAVENAKVVLMEKQDKVSK